MSTKLKAMLRTHRRGDLIITKPVEQWLNEHPEGLILDRKLAMRLADMVQAQPRNRQGLWSASAAGSCARAQMFSYMGAPAAYRLDPRMQNIFNDGTWRHLRWQMMLLTMGVLDDVEVPVYNPDLHLRGTMDGIGKLDNGDEWGWELKSIYSLSAVEAGPKPEHLLQVHSYFISRPTIKKFSLVYEDKRTNIFREFVVEPDLNLLAEVRATFDFLNDSLDREELPDVIADCEKGKGQTFDGCSYRTFCLGCASWEEAVEISIEGS